MSAQLPAICMCLTVLLALGAVSAFPEQGAPTAGEPHRPGRLSPPGFEENAGQTDAATRFLMRGRGFRLRLAADHAEMSLGAASPDRSRRGGTVGMRLLGAKRSPLVTGEGKLPAKSHYLIGSDPSRWRTGVPHYARVRYAGVYPGIDLVYHSGAAADSSSTPGSLEYDFVVAPGADPRQVALRFDGAGSPDVDHRGDLLLSTRCGIVRHRKPVLYQDGSTGREPVTGGYRLDASGTVRFDVGAYDHARPLVIDPVIEFSSYLGGSDDEAVNDIDSVAAGIIVVGGTRSVDFPTRGAIFTDPLDGNYDVFVTKIDSLGAVVYSTYLGGSGSDGAGGIAAASSGGPIWVVGGTRSTDFPVTEDAFDRTLGGIRDGFAAKLPADGSSLLFSSYIGGSGDDEVAAVNLGRTDYPYPYLVGSTRSLDFPVLAPYDATANGGSDAFLVKLHPSGRRAFATYLGGSGNDFGTAVGANNNSQVYVAGSTNSPDFPTTTLQRTPQGGFDAFLTKFPYTGTSLINSTRLGGPGNDFAYGLSGFPTGIPAMCGETASIDDPRTPHYEGFPIVRAVQPRSGGVTDAFVTRFSYNVDAIVFSTYLGGSGRDAAYDLDDTGARANYVTGFTRSPDFPGIDAFQGYGGGMDCFITEHNSFGDVRVYSSHLGGSGDEAGNAVKVLADGRVYLAGGTVSDDFPTVDPFQAARRGSRDGFITRLSPALPVAPVQLAVRSISGSAITLTFTDRADDEDGFSIERRVGTGPFSEHMRIGPGRGIIQFTDNSVSPGNTYSYQVRAFNEAGFSAYSNIATAVVPPVPAAPSDLSARAVSNRIVDLTWRDNSTNEDGFRAYRRRAGEVSFTLLATTSRNVTSYRDGLAAPNTSYDYQVRAFNISGASDSNVAFVTTPP